MNSPLPFERGTTMDASASANVQKLLGQKFEVVDPLEGSNIELQVVKNTDAAVLTARDLVVWENYGNYAVDKTAAEAAPDVAGVVDPAYASSSDFRGAVTPAVNSYLYIVVDGPTEVVSPATTAAHNAITLGDRIMMAGTDDGRCTGIGAVSATTTWLDNAAFSIGRAMVAVSADQVGSNYRVQLNLP